MQDLRAPHPNYLVFTHLDVFRARLLALRLVGRAVVQHLANSLVLCPRPLQPNFFL